MFKVDKKTTTPEQRYWSRFGVFVNSEHISLFSNVSVIDFEPANVSWVCVRINREGWLPLCEISARNLLHVYV